MSETKTYVFPEGGNNSNGLLGVIAPLLKQNGLDPNLLLAMNNGGGFGGGNSGAWFLWIIVILALLRNGFWGNNGGSGSALGDTALASLINNDNGRDLIMSAIQGNGTAISQLASTLNCSVGAIQSAINSVQTQICNIGSQVGLSTQQVINAIQSGNTSIAQQLAQCCCDQRLATCQQTNTLQNTMNSNTLALRDSGTANTNAILSKLDVMQTQALQDKLDALREKNSTLEAQLSNEHQTATIVQSQAQFFNPLNAQLTALQKEVDAIKCGLPQSVNVPYSPVVGVPNCVAYGLGMYGNGGFWG